jgi:hypothetical protein
VGGQSVSRVRLALSSDGNVEATSLTLSEPADILGFTERDPARRSEELLEVRAKQFFLSLNPAQRRPSEEISKKFATRVDKAGRLL